MKNILLMIIFILIQIQPASAAPLRGECSTLVDGKKLVLRGYLSDIFKINSGRGSLHLDGRLISQYDGDDLKVNFFFKNFKLKNAHGELLEGKLINIKEGTGQLTRIYLRSEGIDKRNLNFRCFSK